MSIFKGLNLEQQPHSIALDLRNRVARFDIHKGDRYKAYLEQLGEDGAKLLKLRKHYEHRTDALLSEASSLREAVRTIDETIARLVEGAAWNKGYADAETDFANTSGEEGECDNEEKAS